MKAWPTGFQSPAQTLTRWRVSFADAPSIVVWASSEEEARRAAAFFDDDTVVGVEVVR